MNIVITGSSTGIGRALTERLLQQGHSVWGLARSDQSDLGAGYSGKFQSSRCDVADWNQVKDAAAEIGKQWQHLDALITCAGIQGAIGPACSVEPMLWSTTIRANLDGTYFAFRAFYSLLQNAPRRAKVVCFSGGGATKARPNFSAYGASKAAVVRLVETIAEENKKDALDINAVAPGAITTRLTEEVLAQGPEVVGEAEYKAAQKQMASGGSSLDKVHGLLDFLLSEQSDGISGRLLSAPWDPWATLHKHVAKLSSSDVYLLRRTTAEERGLDFS